ncbi:MAG: hypothetical protein AAB766_02195, partial [Patescibacteria group bacterium]
VASAATLSAGDLIKASGAAVYYYAADGKRYTFPTAATYSTWYADFKSVKTITDKELSAIDLAGNVVVRPGTKLVKITTVPKVFAVSPKGKLSHVASEAAAKTLFGANWKSMVIDVPDGFWTNYTDSGKSLDGTAYPEGQLVKVGSSISYVNADGSWSHVKDDAAFSANKWNNSFVVTTTLTAPATAGAQIAAVVDTNVDASQGGGAGSTAAKGNLTVSLNANTPKGQYVSKNAQNVNFAKFDITATGGDVTVSQIVLSRKGLGYDADVGSIRLYDGATKIGTDQSLNTNTHKVTFKNLSWKVSGTKTLTVKADVASAPGGTNDYFEIAEITAGTSTVAGLPQTGNAMQFSTLSVGELNVAAATNQATAISGEKDKEVGCWNFNTDSTEGFYIDSVKLTNIGTSSSTESLNFVLKQGSLVVPGSTVAAMKSNGTVVFDLTASPYFIDKSQTKKICVYGDILAGITVSKTLRFQVAETADVVARGDSSAGEVLIEVGSAAFSAQSATAVTISQGSATLSQNAAYAPTTGTILVKGVANNKMAAYKLTAGSNEGIKLTKLKLTLAGTNVASTDFSNWSLFKIVNGAEKAVSVSGSVSGLYITFEDTTDGLLNVAKSENETLIVRADTSTSLGGNETAHVYVGANVAGNDTVAKVKGLSSNEYITNGVTLSGVDTGDAQTVTGASAGTLTASKASSSPTATTLAKGSTKNHLLSVNFYATGEDITVSELTLTGVLAGGTGPIATDLTNVYITDVDGKQLGTTVATTSLGVATFSFSLTVPKDTNVIVKAYGDVSTSSTTSDTLHLDITVALSDADTAYTVSGVSSGAADSAITDTGSAIGSTMTVGGPTITAAMSTSPLATSYVIGASGVTMGKLILTSGTTEKVKITSVKISADDANLLATTSSANSNITNVYLQDAVSGALYGSKQNFTDGTPDYVNFTGIENLTLEKGASATLNVVVDFPSGSTTYYVGVKNPTTEITGVGMQSNASLAAADINGGTTTAIASTGATITSSGDLVVSKSSDMPNAAQLVSGTTGVEVMKYKFVASYENADITTLPIYYSSGTAANISKIKLYKDGVILGNVNGYELTALLLDISFAPGTFVVEKDKNVILTIKADINPKAQVVTSATSTYFGIADSTYTATTGVGAASEWGAADGSYNMTVKGVSSGVAITGVDDAAGDVHGSNAFTLHKGILKVSKNSGSPSGTATAGAGSTLLKLDLQAVGDDITVNDVEFVSGGTCTVNGTGIAYLKSSDLATTYAEWTAAAGLNGATPQDWNFSVDETNTAWNAVLSVAAGETKTVVLTGDTTGCTTNGTLQVSLTAPAAGNGTTAGIEYADSSTTNIDLATTGGLPVNGGSLVY